MATKEEVRKAGAESNLTDDDVNMLWEKRFKDKLRALHDEVKEHPFWRTLSNDFHRQLPLSEGRGLSTTFWAAGVKAADKALPIKNINLPSIGKALEMGWLLRIAMLTAAFQSASSTTPSLQ